MPEFKICNKIRDEIEKPPKKTDTEIQEISPEVMKLVMAKVQDIDKKGTAFHAMNNLQHLESILQYGIIKDGPKQWVKQIKERAPKSVWFNIVGRSKRVEVDKDNDSKKEMAHTRFSNMRPYFIIFDLSKLNEVDFNFYQKIDKGEMPGRPGYMPTTEGLNPRNKEFAGITGPGQIAEAGWKRKEEIQVDPSLGFSTKTRVAPRRFQGLVINDHDKVNLYIDNKYMTMKDLSEEQRKKITEELIDQAIKTQLELYKDKPRLLLPIYDTSGNLIWPIQKSYDEIKELITHKKSESGQ